MKLIKSIRNSNPIVAYTIDRNNQTNKKASPLTQLASCIRCTIYDERKITQLIYRRLEITTKKNRNQLFFTAKSKLLLETATTTTTKTKNHHQAQQPTPSSLHIYLRNFRNQLKNKNKI